MEKPESVLMAGWLLDKARTSVVVRANIITTRLEDKHVEFSLYSVTSAELLKVQLALPVSLTATANDELPTHKLIDSSAHGVTDKIDQEVYMWNRDRVYWFEKKLVVVQQTRDGMYSPKKCGLDFFPYLYRVHGILTRHSIGGTYHSMYRHFQQRLGGYLEQQNAVAKKTFRDLWDFQFS